MACWTARNAPFRASAPVKAFTCKGHGLVRVLRCDILHHNILQERGLLRLGEKTERHRPPIRKPDPRDAIVLDVRNNRSRQHCKVHVVPALVQI